MAVGYVARIPLTPVSDVGALRAVSTLPPEAPQSSDIEASLCQEGDLHGATAARGGNSGVKG